MITRLGREMLLKYLSGETPSWAGTIVAGIGRTAPDYEDERLQFQIGEGAIDVALSNIDNGTITLKATIPVGVSGSISELGITTKVSDPGLGSSRLLTVFDSTIEPIAGAIASDQYSRVGTQSAATTALASGTSSISVDNIDMDLSAYESHDMFALAYYQSGTNAVSVEIRLETDDSNYFVATIPTPIIAGYRIVEFTKDSFIATGNPVWSNITRMTFSVNASASGDATIHFDGFRINNRDDNEGILIVRESIDVDDIIVKDAEQELDVEMTLVFDFGA